MLSEQAGPKCLWHRGITLLLILVPRLQRFQRTMQAAKEKQQTARSRPDCRNRHMLCGYGKHFLLCICFQTSYLQFQNNVVILCFEEVFDLD